MKQRGLALVFGSMVLSGGCAPDTITAPSAPSASVIRDGEGRRVGAPLFVVDGRVLARGAEAPNINPSDILNVQVFKGERAVLTYGAEGADGVVVITTRQGAGS
jgi:hypothetical protein